MIVYRIANWQDYFENHRTRALKFLDWILIPNKMDGDGYTELVSHPDGAAHFGCWVALVEIASKCDPRGTLMRDRSKPHDAKSLARVSRLSSEMFEAVIPRLIAIGWILVENIEDKELAQHPPESAGLPPESAGSSPELRILRAERNGTERNTHTHAEPPDGGESVVSNESNDPSGFDRFWAAWPKHERKTNRKACLKRWNSGHLEPLAEEILSGLNRWKASAQWAKEGGRFVPAPLVWITQERWTSADALDPAEQVAGDNGFVRAPFTREVAECIGAPFPVVLLDGTVIGAT